MSARIARIETFRVDYPVAGQFKFFVTKPGGQPCRPTVLTRVTDDGGATGWGQCVPSPRWSYETPETCRSTIDEYLAPALIGHPTADVAGAIARMHRTIGPGISTGQPISKSGLEVALWDLNARRAGQSVVEQLGGAQRDTIPLSWTLNPVDEGQLETGVAAGQARGYRHFNLKVGPDAELDGRLARRLRTLAPDAIIWCDANGGYDLESALAVMPRLAEAGVHVLEQPLPANQPSGYRRLRRRAALPIAMDEGILSLADLDEAIDARLIDAVTLKVSRCGGLTECLAIARRAAEHGLIVLGSSLTDPDVALAATLALFAAIDLEWPAALNAPQFLTSSVLCQPIVVMDGAARVPIGIGLGVEVNEAKLT